MATKLRLDPDLEQASSWNRSNSSFVCHFFKEKSPALVHAAMKHSMQLGAIKDPGRLTPSEKRDG